MIIFLCLIVVVEADELKEICSRHSSYSDAALPEEHVCDLMHGCEVCLFMIAVRY